MTDNPYESPRADLSPTGRSGPNWEWWQDRLALVATAIVIFVGLLASHLAADYFGLSEQSAAIISWGFIGGIALAVAVVRRRIRH